MPLATMIERARAGDRAALGDLLEDQLPFVRAFVRQRAASLTRRRETVEDLIQSIALRATRRIESFEGGDCATFRAWLLAIARRTIVQRFRYWQARKRARPAAAPRLSWDVEGRDDDAVSHLTPSRHAVARERLGLVMAGLGSLTRDQRTVVVLTCFRQVPHAEVSARLGRTPVASRMLLNRARTRLAAELRDAEV